ncbi:MAG: Zn-dependent protease [Candidatus Methanoplasma sp.]|jgi:Zn-dependent protease|nr:Zn-dependent protease [Candidatus Methanoplasma sp.]
MDINSLRRVDPGYRAPKGDIRFSRVEIIHILIAVIVLSVAFTAILYRGSRLNYDSYVLNLVELFAVALLLVVCSFMLHEFGHKFVAQRYNVWSEFRVYPSGLMIALLFSLVAGFLFAAPGAVYIRGNVDREMNGKISLAGPAVNFAVAAVAMALCFSVGGLWGILPMLLYLNAVLGLFNMIPVLPFDGSKIFAWSKLAYVAAIAVGAAEMAVYFLYV